MTNKIILILNKDKQRVCENYCYKEINLAKSVIESGKELFITYTDGSYFKHYEIVEKVEGFEEYGLKITTSKKVWYIH